MSDNTRSDHAESESDLLGDSGVPGSPDTVGGAGRDATGGVHRAGRPVSRQRLHQLAYPHEQAAREALSVAVARGTLVRPAMCQLCGVACAPHGHHASYDRPLDVCWLCARCHAVAHRVINGTIGKETEMLRRHLADTSPAGAAARARGAKGGE